MSGSDLPPLDEDVRGILDRGSRLEPQSAAARARVLAGVAQVVGAGGGGASDASHGVSSRVPRRTAALLRRVGPLVTSFALGSALTALTLRRPAPLAPEKPPQIVYVDRWVERPSSDLPSHALDAGSLPLASQTTARAAGPVRSPSAASPPALAAPGKNDHLGEGVLPSASVEGLAAERRLLNLARVALEREEPQDALEATTRHEHEYPNGILSQEREAMAIRALVALGRTGEAQQRAARFRARFANSLLLPSIDALFDREAPQ